MWWSHHLVLLFNLVSRTVCYTPHSDTRDLPPARAHTLLTGVSRTVPDCYTFPLFITVDGWQENWWGVVTSTSPWVGCCAVPTFLPLHCQSVDVCGLRCVYHRCLKFCSSINIQCCIIPIIRILNRMHCTFYIHRLVGILPTSHYLLHTFSTFCWRKAFQVLLVH